MSKTDLKIIFIPGLGCDERLFSEQMKVFPNAQIMKWEVPEKDMSLSEYAQVLIKMVDDPINTILIGVSLGGIIVQFMASHEKFRQIILVSTGQRSSQMNVMVRLLATLEIQLLLPESWMLPVLSKMTFPFGIKTRADKLLLGDMLRGLPKRFFKWSTSKLSRWKVPQVLCKKIVIHGTADFIFPISSQRADYVIDNSGSPEDLEAKIKELCDQILSK